MNNRCVVALKVSAEAYADVRARIIASGYGDLVIKGPKRGVSLLSAAGADEALNMDGIALVAEVSEQPRAALVNGRYVDISGTDVLTYDRVVALAKLRGEPTIIWRVASTSVKDSGALLPGQSIPARDGLVFDCMHTGNA